MPSQTILADSKCHTRTLWSWPAVAKSAPSDERHTHVCSAPTSIHCSGEGSRSSQKETRFSWPTESTCEPSGMRTMELMPPMRCVSDALRWPSRRSHRRMERSRLAEMTCESSSKTQSEVMAMVCCLRCRIISRVRISHTRTSPSSPPVTTNLRLWLTVRAVTPPRWQLSMLHSSVPSSASCARIWPSRQPVSSTSPVKPSESGGPVRLVWQVPRAVTV
mmetsp:Transcript_75319/g.182062  ORF Transcript_75319/g.182062 Transcript_75319/m.182062 type:complete len:219 (-) Transcript_75319:912-1568(-)